MSLLENGRVDAGVCGLRAGLHDARVGIRLNEEAVPGLERRREAAAMDADVGEEPLEVANELRLGADGGDGRGGLPRVLRNAREPREEVRGRRVGERRLVCAGAVDELPAIVGVRVERGVRRVGLGRVTLIAAAPTQGRAEQPDVDVRDGLELEAPGGARACGRDANDGPRGVDAVRVQQAVEHRLDGRPASRRPRRAWRPSSGRRRGGPPCSSGWAEGEASSRRGRRRRAHPVRYRTDDDVDARGESAAPASVGEEVCPPQATGMALRRRPRKEARFMGESMDRASARCMLGPILPVRKTPSGQSPPPRCPRSLR